VSPVLSDFQRLEVIHNSYKVILELDSITN